MAPLRAELKSTSFYLMSFIKSRITKKKKKSPTFLHFQFDLSTFQYVGISVTSCYFRGRNRAKRKERQETWKSLKTEIEILVDYET